MASQILSDQEILSERLRLLQQLGVSELECTPHTRLFTTSEIEENTKLDARILTTIAMSLTTGAPGEVVAAAFDRRERLSVVLAKNGPVTRADDRSTQRFISAIMDPAVSDGKEMFPFLLSHYWRDMNRRISRLHKSISNIPSSVYSAVRRYKPTSLQDEFRGWILPPGDGESCEDSGSSLQVVIERIFLECSCRSAFMLNPDDLHWSGTKFTELASVVDIMTCSRFLESLKGDSIAANRIWARQVTRRAERMQLYTSGMTDLIAMAQRSFSTGRIPYCWVTTGDDPGSSVHSFQLCDSPSDAIKRVFESEKSGNRLPEDLLPKSISHESKIWQTRRKVTPCVHAELRIILHLSSSWMSNPPPHFFEQHVQQFIGSSKRSCFCCLVWIGAFNCTFLTHWISAWPVDEPAVAKLDAEWALAGEMGGGKWGTFCDKAVLRNAWSALRAELERFRVVK